MKLGLCEVRPGKVLKVVNNYGAIKASAQGIFSEEDDPDLLPPIIPFLMMSPTAFSQPHEGDDVWVWHFSNNPQELFYTYRCNVGDVNSDQLDNEYQDAEIQMKRKSDKGDINVCYTDDDGYTIDNSKSKFNIDNENHDIHMNHAEGTGVSITKDGISLGTDGGSEYKAVCGEELIKSLNDIKDILNAIKTAAMSDPHTTPIGTAMTPLLPKLENFKNMLSNKVTLDK